MSIRPQGAWKQIEDMPRDPDMVGKGAGRWYPTLISLPSGDVLVSSGANENGIRNVHQLVWNEKSAYEELVARIKAVRRLQVEVTGPFRISRTGPLLEVRECFSIHN